MTDANGTAIANQTVNITITDNDKSNSYYSVITNEKGIGKLKLDKDAGKYNVTISYGGNDNYNRCNATKKIAIEEKVVEAQTTSSSSSDSSSSYDSGAFYSPQAGRVIETGEIQEDPGGTKMRHLGNIELPPTFKKLGILDFLTCFN